MKAIRGVLVAVALALFVSACGSDSFDETYVGPGERAVGQTIQAEQAERAGPAGEDGASISNDVITTGTASVRTGEPESAAADFAAAVREEGGRIEFSETGTRGDQPRAVVTARVPAERYEAVVDALSDFGEVVAQSTQATDVTQERVDLQARRDALQTSIDRLTELMTGADSVEDLLRAEEMLTQRQGELDSLLSLIHI